MISEENELTEDLLNLVCEGVELSTEEEEMETLDSQETDEWIVQRYQEELLPVEESIPVNTERKV